MFSFFSGIADVISTVIDFFIDTINALLSFFGYIAMSLETVAGLIILLPTDLKIIAMAFISAGVVFLIIGRSD